MSMDVFDYDSRHPKYGRSDDKLIEDLYDDMDDAAMHCDVCDDEAWRDHMLNCIIYFNNANGCWFDPQRTLSDYENWKRKQKKI